MFIFRYFTELIQHHFQNSTKVPNLLSDVVPLSLLILETTKKKIKYPFLFIFSSI